MCRFTQGGAIQTELGPSLFGKEAWELYAQAFRVEGKGQDGRHLEATEPLKVVVPKSESEA